MAQATPVEVQRGPLPIAPLVQSEQFDDVDEQHEQQEQQPESRKGGRPPNRQVSSREEQEGFWEHIRSLTPEEWERHMCYVYRWEPVMDITRGGVESKYVMMYNADFNIDTLKREQGSGKYELKLNRYDDRTRKDRTVRRIVTDILDKNFPPNLAGGEWLNHSRNARWAWAKEKQASPAQTQGWSGDPLQLMNFIRETIRMERPDVHGSAQNSLVTAVVNQLPALLKQQNESQDPTKLFTTITDLITKFMPKPVEKTAGMDPMIEMMFKNMEAQLAIAREEAKDARKAQAELTTQIITLVSQKNAPPDTTGQIKGLGETLSAVAEIASAIGGGSSAPKEWWQELISQTAPAIAPGVNALLTRVATAPRQQPRQIPPRTVQQQPNANQPAAAPATEAQPATSEAEQIPPEVLETMDSSVIGQVMGVATFVADCLKIGLNGQECAEKFEYNFGPRIYDQVTALPKAMVLSQLKSLPQAWEMLARFEDRLPQFIEEFYEFGSSDGPDGVEPPAPEDVRPSEPSAGGARAEAKPKKKASKKK